MSDDNRPKRAARSVPTHQRRTKKRRVDINPEQQTVLDHEVSHVQITSTVTPGSRVATPSEPTNLEQNVEDTVNLSSSKSQLACHSGIQAVTTPPPSLSVDSSLLAGQSRTEYSQVSLPASSSASYTSGPHTPKTKASQRRKHKVTRAATVRAGKQSVTAEASTAEDDNSKSGYSTTSKMRRSTRTGSSSARKTRHSTRTCQDGSSGTTGKTGHSTRTGEDGSSGTGKTGRSTRTKRKRRTTPHKRQHGELMVIHFSSGDKETLV